MRLKDLTKLLCKERNKIILFNNIIEAGLQAKSGAVRGLK